MFRELRRKKQGLSDREMRRIVENGTYGVLSVIGDDGYPYGVPVNYVYDGESLYFHCAKAGHKMDGISRTDQVSFCIVGADEVLPADFTTAYASVIVFGRAGLVEDPAERLRIFRLLVARFSPGYEAQGEKETQKYDSSTALVRIRMEHMSGKAGLMWKKRQDSGAAEDGNL